MRYIEAQGLEIAHFGTGDVDDATEAANAQFAVTACNHFEELVALARRIANASYSRRDIAILKDEAKQLLAKIESEQEDE